MSGFSLSVTEVEQFRRIVDLCDTSTPDPQGATWAVLDTLQSLIGCDAVIFNGMSPRTFRHYHRQGASWGDHFTGMVGDIARDEADDPFWRLYPTCAPCVHPDLVGGRSVIAHEDFYSQREWLNHPMHLEVNRQVHDEMLVTFPDGQGRTVRLLFPRGRGRPFGDRERFALNLLAPHLERLLMTVRTSPPEVQQPITSRQWQVLDQVRLGLANKQIAHELGLSPGTVRKHLENIYRSLDVQSRGAAVHVAFGDTDGPFHQVGG